MSTLDPTTLTSSAQAFASPSTTLPQLRTLHKTLLAQADDKATRLRTRVGASYRELLGTADAIVRMRADADAAQAVLVRAAGRCGRAPVGTKVRGLERFLLVVEGEGGADRDGNDRENGDGSSYNKVGRRRKEEGDGDGNGGEDHLRTEGRGAAGGVGTRNGLGIVARAKLLDACALVLGRLLRGGQHQNSPTTNNTKERPSVAAAVVVAANGEEKILASRGDRLVVGAKVLLLSRLLAASFGGDGSAVVVEDGGSGTGVGVGIGAAVEATKKSLLGLRRKLVRSIGRVLEDVGDQAQLSDVAKALSAYSLATSSGARDALRHFLGVRKEAMARLVVFPDDEEEGGHGHGRGRGHGPEHVLRALRLYTQTLLHVQALVPYRLTEALAALKRDALLEDEALRGIEGLRLDVYGRWCGDEIQYFTPFIRHDDLGGGGGGGGQQAKEMLAGWAAEAGDMLLRGLEETLEGVSELKAIVDVRTDLLKLWIAEGSKARAFDPSVLLDRFRDVINRRMLAVLAAKVSKLHLLGSEVAATLETWHQQQQQEQGGSDADSRKHRGLWDEGAFDTDLSRGAARFTQDVVARLYGRSDAVSRAVGRYRSWHRIVGDVGAVVDQLRRQRWDGDVDEDEDVIEARQQALSRDDPRQLAEHLDASLAAAFSTLDEQLGDLWRRTAALEDEGDGKDRDRNGDGEKGAVAMYLVRVLRDVRAQLPSLEAVQGFGLAVVPSLHEAVTAAVVAAPLERFCASAALRRRLVVARPLWEGEPPLPTAPSPGVFRFLRDLTVAMGDAGSDLWSPGAVAVLKQRVVAGFAGPWRDALAARLAEAVEVAEEKIEEKTDRAEQAEEADEKPELAENGGNDGEGPDKNGSTAETKPKPAAATTAEQRRDLLVQWLFDVSYLRCFLGSQSASTSRDAELGGLEDAFYAGAGLESEESADVRQRVAKMAQEYWKKTNLLFGLLA